MVIYWTNNEGPKNYTRSARFYAYKYIWTLLVISPTFELGEDLHMDSVSYISYSFELEDLHMDNVSVISPLFWIRRLTYRQCYCYISYSFELGENLHMDSVTVISPTLLS